MTHEEFRGDPELVKWMREVTEHPHFELAKQAMRTIDPVRSPAKDDVTPHGAHILLGEQTGWAQYEIEFLKLATRLPAAQALPPPDYLEPENKPEENES